MGIQGEKVRDRKIVRHRSTRKAREVDVDRRKRETNAGFWNAKATKNENLEKLLTLTKAAIDGIIAGNIPDEEIDRSKGLLAASFPFRFEKSSVFLGQLIDLDHKGKSFDTLQKYPKEIYSLEKENLRRGVKEIFDWNKQVIVVVGTKDLKKPLRKFGKVTVLPYKKFL